MVENLPSLAIVFGVVCSVLETANWILGIRYPFPTTNLKILTGLVIYILTLKKFVS